MARESRARIPGLPGFPGLPGLPGHLGLLGLLGVLSCITARQERAAPAAPTFARDVAPLVYRSCAPCHHPGGSGPFPLTGYEEIRRRARQIAIVTETRFMPPWKPAPGYGAFHDERRLTEAEIRMLSAWAANGAPLGDPADVPPAPVFEDEWLLGPPDVVLSMDEPYAVPAEGKDAYRTLVIQSGFEETRYVRAFDFRPDNPPPVHHIITLADPSGAARRRDAETPGVGYEGMIAEDELFGSEVHGWGPGGTARFLPEGSAWRIEAGTDFVLDTHFQTTGRVEHVKISVGIYFADEAPRAPMMNLSLSATILCIPPGMADYTVDYAFELPVPVTLVAIQPHAHYVARDLRVTAVTDAGERIPLIRIPDWDFSWQDSYTLVEPLPLPAGTRIEMHYVFDNSAANDRNPFDPPRRILSGPRSSDEMALCWMQVAVLPEHRAELAAEVARYHQDVRDRSLLFDQLFRGVILGFDADGDGMLDAGEDALASEYLDALPEHPHAMAFDRNGDGELDADEKDLLAHARELWNGRRR